MPERTRFRARVAVRAHAGRHLLPVGSCVLPVSRATDRRITTIERLGTARPHPLQAAFIVEQAAQCGFCVPGMVMTGAALIGWKPRSLRAKTGAGRGIADIHYKRNACWRRWRDATARAMNHLAPVTTHPALAS